MAIPLCACVRYFIIFLAKVSLEDLFNSIKSVTYSMLAVLRYLTLSLSVSHSQESKQ